VFVAKRKRPRDRYPHNAGIYFWRLRLRQPITAATDIDARRPVLDAMAVTRYVARVMRMLDRTLQLLTTRSRATAGYTQSIAD